MINWTEVVISICTLLITSVLVPFVFKTYKQNVSREKQETIEYWTDTAVRWAKQWMQTEEGQAKKKAVRDYLEVKLEQLGIELSLEDLDMIIEAVYERVKKEAEYIELAELTAPPTE